MRTLPAGTVIPVWPAREWVLGVRAIDPAGVTHLSSVETPLVGGHIEGLCGVEHVATGLYYGGNRFVRLSMIRLEPSAYEDEPMCPQCLSVFVRTPNPSKAGQE